MITPELAALDIEREIAERGEVEFAPGVYCLERAITLRGLTGIRVTGSKDTVICGGTRAQIDWTKVDNMIYAAPIRPGLSVDGLRAGGVAYRQARYPHASDDGIYEGCAADALLFAQKCAHPEDGYLHALHSDMWGDMHYRLKRSADGSIALEGGHQNNRPMGIHAEYRYVENLREALGAPGEYFYDAREGVIYVCSREKPARDAVLITNARLLRVENCAGVSIEGITFSGGARTFMEAYEPLLRSDWCIHRGGAVFVEDSHGVNVRGCEFTDIGSNALFFSGNTSNCIVSDCVFNNIGASAVAFVGRPDCVRFACTDVDAGEYYPEDTRGVGPVSQNYTRDCAVVNCVMNNIGRTEKQTACVEISMSARIRLSRLTLSTCPRAAVNISEGTFGGHVIEYCDIYDTVRETGDHGSINGWGRDRYWHAANVSEDNKRALALRDAVETTIIRYNRVRCSRGWDIDLDDGCSNYLIEHNLLMEGGLKFREGYLRTARGNIIVNNTFHPHVWFENSGDIFENNLVMKPYLPIGMPDIWGASINNNILAADCALRKARELSLLSGQDADSIALEVKLDSDCLPTAPEIRERFSIPRKFGAELPKR